METGNVVTIIQSKELIAMNLDGLCGKKAIIRDVLDAENRKTKGCWVELYDESFLGENEWFIPVESVKI